MVGGRGVQSYQYASRRWSTLITNQTGRTPLREDNAPVSRSQSPFWGSPSLKPDYVTLPCLRKTTESA